MDGPADGVGDGRVEPPEERLRGSARSEYLGALENAKGAAGSGRYLRGSEPAEPGGLRLGGIAAGAALVAATARPSLRSKMPKWFRNAVANAAGKRSEDSAVFRLAQFKSSAVSHRIPNIKLVMYDLRARLIR
jgi:hypothetical protein